MNVFTASNFITFLAFRAEFFVKLKLSNIVSCYVTESTCYFNPPNLIFFILNGVEIVQITFDEEFNFGCRIVIFLRFAAFRFLRDGKVNCILYFNRDALV